ncbi:MAG: Gfo/Idh/MocA family oxidoreductase [Nocardioides sp.]|nr:Gfo/Idh/MocA family oxidoreductase [Nocardioides sp.]
MTTRVLMVGAGGVAQRHAAVLSALEGPEGGAAIVGVVDPDQTAAQILASAHGCPDYRVIEQALDSSEPDAVYVCVPPFAHGEAEYAAIERALPLFVEKPVGLDPTLVENIAARIQQAGIVTGTGYHWRCLDVVEQAQKLLATNPPMMAAGHWLDKRPPVAWWGQRDKSGGQVVEQLTHLLDLARLLLGEAEEVYAAGARLTHSVSDIERGGDIDDATAATVRFASGAVATFSATSLLVSKHRSSLQTFSDALALELTETGLAIDRGRDHDDVTVLEDPRVTVDREFIEAVTGLRATTRTPYEEAARTQQLGAALAESALVGQPVRIGHPDPGTRT